MVRTKIIATLGPASSTASVIRRMTRAGLDVARLNCSHSTVDDLLEKIKAVRRANEKYRRRVKMLLDLEGPRMRVGRLKHHRPIPVKKGQVIWLTHEDVAGEGRLVPLDYPGPFRSIKGAEYVYIDDGNISLKVIEVGEKRIKTRVEVGGVIKERKGINAPGAPLEFPVLNEKDEEDIYFGLEHGVDYIAQSFVRNKEDIQAVKEIVTKHCAVIAKIENWDGVRKIDEIIDSCDGIMVARGDMGVSIPIYEVPIIQKVIIGKCNKKGKFVITATQMLESMTERLRPTRAEVADVANAIIDGTDFVMLSGETAVGKHPVEAVKMMNEIIKFTEKAVAKKYWSYV